MRRAALALAFASLALAPALVRAADPAPAPLDKAAVEQIIHDYLTREHPEVLYEGAAEYEKRQSQMSSDKSEAAIAGVADKIYKNPTTPTGGNPAGDVTLVEFFDYQCGYCKMAESGVEKAVKEDGKVKVIYEEFPILGPDSTVASKAALAAQKQGKYVEFHNALMSQGHITEKVILDTAKTVGLDVDKMMKDAEDPAINTTIQQNLSLATSIGVRGTPMFIIGKHIYPGAMKYEEIKKALQETRAAKS